jgi:hypothetical protein
MRRAKPKLLTERQWLKRVHPTPMIRHLEALRLIRHKESAGRKRVTFTAAVCRRLFPLLNQPDVAKPTERLIFVMEAYAQGVRTDHDLLRAGCDWRESELIGYPTTFNPNDPLSPATCQSYVSSCVGDHMRSRHPQSLQSLPDELQNRVRFGIQALYLFSLDSGRAPNSKERDDTQWLIKGCLDAAIAAGGTDGAGELAHQCGIIRDIFGNPFHKRPKFDTRWRTETVLALARQMYESRDFTAMPILADALQDAECDNADILDHCRGPGPHVRGCWVVDLVLGKE